MKRNILIIALAFLVFQLNAQNGSINAHINRLNAVSTAVPFLIIAPDARAGALGDAGVSSSPDPCSMHWNPAKFAFIDKGFGVEISYAPWLRKLTNDINLANLSLFYRINKRQVVAASLTYFSLGNITFTDEIGNTTGTFKPNEFAVDASYSFKFTDYFSGAIAFRYIYSNLTGGAYVAGAATKPGQSVAADIAIFYSKPLKFKTKGDALFNFGLNISNIGAKISYSDNLDRDFLPTNLRFGPSLTYNFDKYNSLTAMIDINKLLVPTTPIYKTDSTGKFVRDANGTLIIESGKNPNVSPVQGMLQSFYDAPGGFSEEMKEFYYGFGLEYWYDKQFSVRAGYFLENKYKGNRKYFTVGAGLRYSVFGLDFSYLIPTGDAHNPLENTLRFSLLFNFDSFKKGAKGNDDNDKSPIRKD
jgi:hypothetical protein